MSLKEKACKIHAIVLDVDGVLTDGRIGYGGGQEEEIKFFHVRDGHGLKMAKRAGLKTGILSGRGSEANRRRARELELDFIYENKKNKKEAFEVLLKENGLDATECMYIGDDVVDIPVLKLAGIAVTVSNAPDYMDGFCHFRTKLPGGSGAVREAVEWLLKEQDKWEDLMKRYVS